MLELRGLRQENYYVFKAILDSIMSSRPVHAKNYHTCSKKMYKKNPKLKFKAIKLYHDPAR